MDKILVNNGQFTMVVQHGVLKNMVELINVI